MEASVQRRGRTRRNLARDLEGVRSGNSARATARSRTARSHQKCRRHRRRSRRGARHACSKALPPAPLRVRLPLRAPAARNRKVLRRGRAEIAKPLRASRTVPRCRANARGGARPCGAAPGRLPRVASARTPLRRRSRARPRRRRVAAVRQADHVCGVGRALGAATRCAAAAGQGGARAARRVPLQARPRDAHGGAAPDRKGLPRRLAALAVT
mmetsp:Transcript_13821/g.32306  ORF Transcript_13821/g.32306 Transcript_13821/m.32306 type:complete len:213 (-) Transcript_13821:121-759(-)